MLAALGFSAPGVGNGRSGAAPERSTSDLVAKEEVSGSPVLTINGYSLTNKSRHIHCRYYRKHFEVWLLK